MAYSKTGDGYASLTEIFAGRLYDGTLIITSGQYSVQSFDAGSPVGATPTTGSITLTGSTTDVTVEDPGDAGFYASINIGRNFNGGAGTGYLSILDGATLTSINEGYENANGFILGGYNNVNIGRGTGTFGMVTVNGIGSSLIARGAAARITVGRDGGTGELRIENGAFVGTFDLDVGRGDIPTVGRLTINGAGSTLIASADYGFYGFAYAGAQGFLDIGRGDAGRGYLTVSNGGTFTTQNVDGVTDLPILRIGRDNGSYGNALVTGAGSSLNVTQIGAQGDDYSGGATLLVGQGGQGILTVADNAQVNVVGDKATLNVASGRYSGGVPDNTTDQSQLLIYSGADVLVDSQGYRGAELRIGGGALTNGKIVVDGAGSTLTVRADTGYTNDSQSGMLIVGDRGTGVLDVSNGGAVDANRIHVGNSTAFDNYGNPFTAGDGTLNINSGGTVTATKVASGYWYMGVRIGVNGATGTANIDGAGSALISQDGAGVLRVGLNGGTGTLNIDNGGMAGGFQVEIGRGNGGTGYLTVDGIGSTLISSDAYGGWQAPYGDQAGAFRIGRGNGYGKAVVTNGGTIEVRNQSYGGGYYSVVDLALFDVGRDFGSVGILDIDGLGSAVNVTLHGSSTDAYAPGNGIYYGPLARLGNRGGDGTVTVKNFGAFNVTGEGATLRVSDSSDPFGGGAPESLLRIETGGMVTVESLGHEVGATVSVGHGLDTDGRLEIVGPGSTLTVRSDNVDDVITGGARAFSSAVIIGRQGEGDLLVSGGGTIDIDGADDTFPAFIVGRGADDGSAYAVGNATVTGAGSSVTITGTGADTGTYGAAGFIAVGQYDNATGTLTISDGGAVVNAAANASAQIGANIGSTGTVIVDGAASLFDAGMLLTIGAGFDFTTFNVLPNDGGTGLLTLINGGVVTADRIAVGVTGTISGTGTINGNVELLGGTLTPGPSTLGPLTGDISISGDLLAGAGSTIALEIVQFGAPGQFDSISVGGTATLDLGSLALALPGGVPVAAGSTMDLITATGDLSLTGVDFTAVLLRQFGTVPAVGATTLNGQVQGYLLADTGSVLQLQALGDDASGPAGAIDFGAATLDGVDLTARNGFGAGTGGGFDSFALLGVSSVAGTAGADTIILETTSNVTVSGRDNNDILVTGAGDDTIDGGLGDDVIQAGGGTNTITTGGGFDLIVGSAAELDGDTVTDISGDESFAVRDGSGVFVAATIVATAGFITIDIGGDGSIEATLVNGSGFVGTLSSFTGPDPIPAEPNAVSVQGAGFFVAQVDEGDAGTTGVTFTVVRSGDLSEDLIVDYAVAGSGSNPADAADFNGGVLPAGSVTILAGQASADVTVLIQGDNDNTETNEDFTFTITGAVTGSGGSVAINDPTAFARILDDDVLRISVSDAPDVFETTIGGTTELIFTVFRVGDSSGEVTVNYSLSGGPAGEELDLLADSADVVGGLPQSGSVVLASGVNSAQVIVQIIGDDQIEPREDVTITLTGFSVDGGVAQTDFVTQQATGTIFNDDGQPPVIPDGLAAWFFGDPHLVTLDGLGYDFQAVGEFTLLTTSGGTNPAFDIPIEVQIRTAPAAGSDLVSVNVAMATMLGASEVMIDVTSEPKLLVDGVATGIPADQGFIVVGDGQVFFDGAIYTIVYSTGEQVRVEVFDDFLNVGVFLGDGRDISGLLGNGDGDITNDFELRDGTVLGETLDFDVLYGDYADSWRIADATSLFTYGAGEDTAFFTDASFPKGVITLDDLPDELVAMAEAFAAEAGITDPALLEAAILDFALTGDKEFAAGASGVEADPVATVEPANAPVLPTSFGVTVDPTGFIEGDDGATDVVFTIYRLGDASEAVTVDYAISGGIDAADLAAGAALAGAVAFAIDQTVATVTIAVLGDLDVEGAEALTMAISVDGTAFPDVLIAAPSATATIANDDFADASFSIVALTPSVQEGNDTGGVIRFQITRSGSVFGISEVDLAIGPASAGIAADGFDILGGAFPAVQTLVFAPGETVKIIEVAISPDFDPEDNEGVEASLTNPVGATIGVAAASALILDDDGDISGGNGDDILDGTEDGEEIFGNGGNDIIDGNGGDDTIDGGSGEDRIKGGKGNDTIFGGDDNDDLFGNDGNDLIEGGDGDDLLKGGSGDDTLTGGAGDDMMWGNGGSDTFVFSPGDGFDKIRDFKAGVDLIDLSLVTSVTGFDDLVFSGRGKKVIVDYGEGEVLLAGVKESDLDADSFIFG